MVELYVGHKMKALISTIIGHLLAWSPLVLAASTFVYFQCFSDEDFGLASIILNKYISPIIVGGALSLLCLVLNSLRISFSNTFEATWYDKMGYWSQGLMILALVIGFVWSRASL